MPAVNRLPYVWDYDLDEAQFVEILEGRRVFGRLDQDWAARRLLEYAPCAEIVRLIGFPKLVQNWPRWRGRFRSRSRQRGFDFLVQWLNEHSPPGYLRRTATAVETLAASVKRPKGIRCRKNVRGELSARNYTFLAVKSCNVLRMRSRVATLTHPKVLTTID
jgi:hypothetical protein